MGKSTNEMENNIFSRVHQLFLWPFSTATCKRLPKGTNPLPLRDREVTTWHQKLFSYVEDRLILSRYIQMIPWKFSQGLTTKVNPYICIYIYRERENMYIIMYIYIYIPLSHIYISPYVRYPINTHGYN